MNLTGEKIVALETFGEVWNDGMLLYEIAPRLTCREAEALAGALGAIVGPDVERLALEAHAEGDTDCEDLHHPGCHSCMESA